ncbi:MAG: type 4a pilus biogenesis protein PilO [Fimbriimonadaceae bacterium]
MNKTLKPESLWSVALALSLALFVGALMLVFMPKPAAAAAGREKAAELRGIREMTMRAQQLYLEIDASNERLIWNQDAQTIGAKALEMVSRKARAFELKLSAFRPQRETDVGALRQLPFLILVEGTYPKVAAFLSSLEQPLTKLAVNGIQIASSDGASDGVTASITVIAFIKKL